MSLDSPDFGEHSKAVFTDNESCTNFNGSDHISSNNSNGNSINNSTSNSNNNSYYNSDSVSNSNNNSAYNSYSNSFTSNSSSNPFQVFLNSQPRSRFGSEFSDQNNISGSAVIQSYNSMVQQVSDFFQTDKEGDTDSDVVVFSRGSGDGSTNNSTRRSTESKSKVT